MRVTGVYKDSLNRQVMGKVQKQNVKGPVLMNRRTEHGGVRIESTRYRRWGNTQWKTLWRYPPPTPCQGGEEVIPRQVEPWGVLEEREWIVLEGRQSQKV